MKKTRVFVKRMELADLPESRVKRTDCEPGVSEVFVKKENCSDDPLYQPLDDSNISRVIKEEFEEEDTVLQSQDEIEISSLPKLVKVDGGSQYTEDTSSTNVADDNAGPLKSERSPELVIFPLTTGGHLQVKSGKKTTTNTAVWILNTPTSAAGATNALKRVIPAAPPPQEEADDDDDDDYEPTPAKRRERRKKERHVDMWTTSSASMKTLRCTKPKAWLMPKTTEPFDYFNYFYDDNYLQQIADETNKEALNKKDHRYDYVHLRSWINVTVSEMKIFLGLLLHTGTAKMMHLGDYWRQHRLFKSCFRDYMTPQRFTAIMRYFIIPDCADDNDGLSERFNSIMDKIYYPGRNLNLDTTIIDWSLKSMHGQYQPSMEKTNLTRITTLCEQDGTIINISIGSTLRKVPDMETSMFKILRGKLDAGHSLNISNAIRISPALALRLLQKKTYCTAVNIDIPKQLTAQMIEPGQNLSIFRLGVHAGKYNSGSANNYYLSTEFKDDMKQSKSSQFTEPVALSSHAERYKSIERVDLFEYYPCEVHKLARLKKIFVHCLMLSLLNANLLHNSFSGSPLNFPNYRLKVIEHLLPELESEQADSKENIVKMGETKSKVGGSTQSSGTARESGEASSGREKPHRLSKIHKTKNRVSEDGKVVKATLRRQCKNCRYVREIRKNCIYECRGCKGSPALCLECFFEMHNVTV